MNLKTLAALALLGLASTAARAELICDNCTHHSYLGGHWPGDRSTISGQNASPIAPIDHLYVIDLNANGALTVTLAGTTAMRATLQIDEGSVCTVVGVACSPIVLGPVVGSRLRRVRAALVAGRYVLRVQGPAGAAYSGLLTLK